jgi:hypothetical protein
MNGGSLPGSRPGDRRIINRDESADNPRAEESIASRVQARPVQPPVASTKPKSRKKLDLSLVKNKFFVAVVIVAVLVLGLVAILNKNTAGLAIDSSKYQAVFLAGGQHYFGNLKSLDDDFFELTGVYYLYKQDDTEVQEQENSNLQLLKLVDDVHGPEDRMIISKSQVLFYENLRTDSRVSQLINQQSR